MNLVVIDSSLDRQPQTTTLTRIFRLHETVTSYRVRVTVRWNSYEQQSNAMAEVLTPALTWTHLLNSPTSVWWEAAKMAHHAKKLADEQQILENVAEELTQRAGRVLL